MRVDADARACPLWSCRLGPALLDKNLIGAVRYGSNSGAVRYGSNTLLLHDVIDSIRSKSNSENMAQNPDVWI